MNRVHSACGSIPVEGGAGDWRAIETAPRDGTEIQARIPGHGDDNLIAFVYIGDCGVDGGDAYGWAFTTEQEPAGRTATAGPKTKTVNLRSSRRTGGTHDR